MKNDSKDKTKLFIEIILFVLVLFGITFLYYFVGNETGNEENMKSAPILHANDSNFEEIVLNSDKPVILEFFSNSCPPCLTMIPTMINIAKNNKDVKVVSINASEKESQEVVKKYSIQAYPTILIIKNGEVVKNFVGATNEENIMKALK